MKILFCGGGALGSHALFLARELEHELAVIDFDRVETKNLAAQWFVKQMVGKNKATALKLQLLNFYDVKIRDHAVKLTPLNVDTLLGSAGLVVECFDNAESRRLVQDFVRARQKPCVHAGLAANGEFGVVRWDKDFVIDAEDAAGQATCEGRGFLPLIVRLSGALVASIQFFLTDGRQVNWNISPRNAESF
ncbi:MAG: ThiF family adenylyltransferase [Verrucomicrobia bacterium]|nr:ThiF family adenylyltransferase [Verrucomicrobiota bacterium]